MKQLDTIVVDKEPAVELSIKRLVDNLTILPTGDVDLTTPTSVTDEVVARYQSDDITVQKAPSIDLVLVG